MELANDLHRSYNDEFLYYWGMICIGSASSLIVKNLDTAIFCFERIRKAVPKTEARLAYIKLLLSEESHKSDENARNLDILREWAGRNDHFSMIVLSKITFEHFLGELQRTTQFRNSSVNIPVRAIRLLEQPYQAGHPEAIKCFNIMMRHLAYNGIYTIHHNKIDMPRLNTDTLYDF